MRFVVWFAFVITTFFVAMPHVCGQQSPIEDPEKRAKVALELMTRWHDAIDSLDSAKSTTSLARMLTYIDRPEESIKAMEKGILFEVAPESVGLVAGLLLQQDRLEETVELFDRFSAYPKSLIGEDRPGGTVTDRVFTWYCKEGRYEDAVEFAEATMKRFDLDQGNSDRYMKCLYYFMAEQAAANGEFLIAEENASKVLEMWQDTLRKQFVILAYEQGMNDRAMAYFESVEAQQKMLPQFVRLLAGQCDGPSIERLLNDARDKNFSSAPEADGMTFTATGPHLELMIRVEAAKALPDTKAGNELKVQLLDGAMKRIKEIEYSKDNAHLRRDLSRVLISLGRMEDAVTMLEFGSPEGAGFFVGLDIGEGYYLSRWASGKIAAGQLEEVLDLAEMMTRRGLQVEITHLKMYGDENDLDQYSSEEQQRFQQLVVTSRIELFRLLERDAWEFRQHKRAVIQGLLNLEKLDELKAFDKEFNHDSSAAIRFHELLKQSHAKLPLDEKLVKELTEHETLNLIAELILNHRVGDALALVPQIPEKTPDSFTTIFNAVLNSKDRKANVDRICEFMQRTVPDSEIEELDGASWRFLQADPETEFLLWTQMADAYPECGWLASYAARSSAGQGNKELTLKYIFERKHDQKLRAAEWSVRQCQSATLIAAIVDKFTTVDGTEEQRDNFYLASVGKLASRGHIDEAIQLSERIKSSTVRCNSYKKIVHRVLGLRP